jgi:hypothetical protein
LKSGVEPPDEVLDSLDPTNLSYDGTVSSRGSIDSIKVASAASDERKRLVRKQTRRQSLLPSFFEPTNRKSCKPSAPSTAEPVALTAAALTQHDYPAVAFLAPPARIVRRAISFAGPVPPLPIIRIVKPAPQCLDDHSNPSSRDPFYYDKVLDGMQDDRPSSPPRRRRRRISSKVDRPPSGIDQDGVTAWFADQYLAAA